MQRIIPKVSHPVFAEIMAVFCNHDLEDIAKDILEKALGRRKASASMLLCVPAFRGVYRKMESYIKK